MHKQGKHREKKPGANNVHNSRVTMSKRTRMQEGCLLWPNRVRSQMENTHKSLRQTRIMCQVQFILSSCSAASHSHAGDSEFAVQVSNVSCFDLPKQTKPHKYQPSGVAAPPPRLHGSSHKSTVSFEKRTDAPRLIEGTLMLRLTSRRSALVVRGAYVRWELNCKTGARKRWRNTGWIYIQGRVCMST